MFSYTKWFSYVGSFITLTSIVLNLHHIEGGKLNDLANEFSKSTTSSTDKPYIIVSTMDGKVSALDAKHGASAWSVDIGQGPLVSSSISKLQINQNGKVIRLIPSLSGGLFQFDGNSVKALPFSADQLLSSSFKVSDDSILVGGKEVTTFGLDSSNGEIVYFCYVGGCETLREALPGSNIIIVKRGQQTVQSVQNRNGQENWNFSVGEVELDVSKSKAYQLIEHSGEGEHSKDGNEEEDVSEHPKIERGTCDERDTVKSHPCTILKKMKVSVPDGSVFVSDDEKVHWKHKFSSPIANTWYVNDGEHRKINLFDPNMVPALHENNSKENTADPTIYMGFFNTHVYIQVSTATQKAITKSTTSSHLITSRHPFLHSVKFPYRPFVATSDHLTEAVVGEAKQGEVAVYAKSNEKGSCGKSLAVYEDFDNKADVGYYFKSKIPYFGSISESGKKRRTTELGAGSESYGDSNIDVVYSSLMLWREEILYISHIIFIFIGLCIAAKIVWIVVVALITSKKQQLIDPSVFKSRYIQDFKPIGCIGKGGFGVVIESMNKMDRCRYAIKRIRLQNKPSARKKVMREVEVLARLKHKNIVGYCNAWYEKPPQGWQEKTDKEIMPYLSSFQSSGLYSSTGPTGIKKMKSQSGSNEASDFSGQTDSDANVGNSVPSAENSVVFENTNEKTRSTNEKPRKNKKIIGSIFLYIQMQLCQKGSLETWLKNNHERDQKRCLRIFHKVLSAVKYVHKKNLIHRDLKPSNIFFSLDDVIKVGDFGLVTKTGDKMIDDISKKSEINTEEYTTDEGTHTAMAGTMLYMAPEQMRGGNYGKKVDIFALGLILIELFSSFSSDNERFYVMINARRSTFDKKFLNNYPNEARLAKQMLSSQPSQRPTAQQVILEIKIIERVF